MKTSSPSSAAEAIPVEAVTMGTDCEAMLSPPSEGRDSVKTVTDRDRESGAWWSVRISNWYPCAECVLPGAATCKGVVGTLLPPPSSSWAARNRGDSYIPRPTYTAVIRQAGFILTINQGYVTVYFRCVCVYVGGLPPWEASCPRSECEADVWGNRSSGGPNLNLVDRPATWGELRGLQTAMMWVTLSTEVLILPRWSQRSQWRTFCYSPFYTSSFFYNELNHLPPTLVRLTNIGGSLFIHFWFFPIFVLTFYPEGNLLRKLFFKIWWTVFACSGKQCLDPYPEVWFAVRKLVSTLLCAALMHYRVLSL